MISFFLNLHLIQTINFCTLLLTASCVTE